MAPSVDVIVAGAGPVGMTLACDLALQGVSCRVLDRAPARAAQSRATDLHARSLELWDHIGVAGEILQRGIAIASVPMISAGREIARLDFTGIDSDAPAALSLRQRELEDILEARLKALGIEVERGVSVEGFEDGGEGVTVSLGPTGDRARCRWLVACDGVHSHLRELAGIRFRGGEYAGRWAVMDARFDGWRFAADELPVFLDGDGFWAMPLGDRWRLFFRADHVTGAPSVADAQAVLDRHACGGARVVDAENRATFQLHHRVARHYRAGRLLLAGDAAHAMTPVLGMGLNTGVQDAFNLAWKLRAVLSGGPDAVIDSYEAERRPVALEAVRSSDAVHTANQLEGEAGRQRDLELATALSTPARILGAVEAGHELNVAYHASPIVGTGGAGAAGTAVPGPGDRVGDTAPLVRAGGTATSLAELLRTRRTLVLWLGGDRPPARAGEACAALEQRFPGLVDAWVVAIAAAPEEGARHVLADPALRAHGRLGAVHDVALVVRPDGYVGYRCEPPDADALAGHLTALLGPRERPARPADGAAG